MNVSRNQVAKVLHTDAHAFTQLNEAIVGLLPKGLSEIVVICIGTDRSNGDSFGPFVGKFLSEKSIDHVHVYGTLSEPVHAVNIHEVLAEVKAKHPKSYVIAVDACLGRTDSLGCIIPEKKALKPGAGVGKDLPEVGDVCINGVVNMSGFMEYFVLQSTRLHVVYEMATLTARSLAYVLSRYSFRKPITPFVPRDYFAKGFIWSQKHT